MLFTYNTYNICCKHITHITHVAYIQHIYHMLFTYNTYARVNYVHFPGFKFYSFRLLLMLQCCSLHIEISLRTDNSFHFIAAPCMNINLNSCKLYSYKNFVLSPVVNLHEAVVYAVYSKVLKFYYKQTPSTKT